MGNGSNVEDIDLKLITWFQSGKYGFNVEVWIEVEKLLSGNDCGLDRCPQLGESL